MTTDWSSTRSPASAATRTRWTAAAGSCSRSRATSPAAPGTYRYAGTLQDVPGIGTTLQAVLYRNSSTARAVSGTETACIRLCQVQYKHPPRCTRYTVQYIQAHIRQYRSCRQYHNLNYRQYIHLQALQGTV